MANPVKGEVALESGGRKYTMVLGTYALAALERRMKMPWATLFKRAADENQWGIDETLAMFHASLLRHQRSMTEEQAADLIDELGVTRVNAALVEAIGLMMPRFTGQQDGGQGAENPPTGPMNGTGINDSQIGSPQA